MEWYYASNGEKKGPVSDEVFAKLARDGVIRAETLVWRAGMPNWQAYSLATAGASIGASPGATPDGGAEDAETAVCAASGKRFPKREMIQFEGKWVSSQHRDEFFQRMREGVAQPGDFAAFGYGGFWRRFVARIVDALILWVVGVVVGAVVGGILGALGGLNRPVLFQVVIQLAAIAAAISYDVFFIRKYDATPGKMALGLQVLRSTGDSLSVGRIVGRYFSHILNVFTLSIGYIIAAFDEEKRALHDRICDTRVVKTR